MKKGLAFTIFGAAVVMALFTSDALAGDDEIWGTYKLIGATNKILDTGNTVNSYGEHPKGYITYGKEGRMLVLITYDGRPKPPDVLKTSIEERDALYRSMTAYGGTYTYTGNRIEHHVDISWDETRSGTTVVRTITRDGNRLTYVTEPFLSRNQETFGKMIVQTLIWEKLQ
jgi:Lipocalin-like domain